METIAIIFIVVVIIADIFDSIKKYRMKGSGCLGAIIKVIIEIVLGVIGACLIGYFFG